MPVLHFPIQRLRKLLGGLEEDRIRDTIPRLGADPDLMSGPTWAVEFFPDRPDLLTTEGLARALRAYLGIEPGLRQYALQAARVTLRVDAPVRDVRPVMVGGVARGVPIDEDGLRGLMEFQEDLHWGVGARRRKVSLGIHDLARVEPPFTYTLADWDGLRFVPLHGTEPLSPREILAKHDKGVEYAHLLEGAKGAPVILDKRGRVLSMPPIINGTDTTLTTETREVLVDVTGADETACRKVLNLVMCQLADMGATLERVRLKTPEGSATTPDLKPRNARVALDEINRLLGLALSPADACAALHRMGLGATASRSGRTLDVQIPAYRVDFLHAWDIVEDVAIGHGYDRFPRSPLRAPTVGTALPLEVACEAARDVFTGLGFLECVTLTLTSSEALHGRTGRSGTHVKVLNPVSVDHTGLRTALLPGLLDIASRNTARDLPQRLFEIGDVVLPGPTLRQERHAAALVVAPDAGFTLAKQLIEAALRELALPLKERDAADPLFIEGRAVQYVDGERVLAVGGEVHPRWLGAWTIPNPVVGIELSPWRMPQGETWGPGRAGSGPPTG